MTQEIYENARYYKAEEIEKWNCRKEIEPNPKI